MNIVNVPLSDLEFSPANHRKTGGNNVEDLTASIRAHGLLQNLTVVQALRGAKHQVIAGGRRLRALRLLHDQGHIPADWPVPCNVVAGNEAEEASLTENVSREAMHPADEFDAFRKLADEGTSVGDIAARFGKSERYVQQRMRLAHVAPPILREYRDGKATLEQMMALAITEDQDRQLRVWKATLGEWQRRPEELRAHLVEGKLAVTSAIGKFIGADAYEKAGGVVRRNLFGDDKDSYLTDRELANKLALEKLERTAEKIRKEGWAWVEARIEFGYQAEQQFGKAPVTWKGNKETYTDDVKQHAGKEPVRLILQAMPRALLEVSKVGAFGAKKYSENGWRAVPNGVNRYTDAMLRHALKEGIEQRDADSGMLHAAQVAWNALARLELMLESFDSGVQRREAFAGTTDQDPAE